MVRWYSKAKSGGPAYYKQYIILEIILVFMFLFLNLRVPGTDLTKGRLLNIVSEGF